MELFRGHAGTGNKYLIYLIYLFHINLYLVDEDRSQLLLRQHLTEERNENQVKNLRERLVWKSFLVTSVNITTQIVEKLEQIRAKKFILDLVEHISYCGFLETREKICGLSGSTNLCYCVLQLIKAGTNFTEKKSRKIIGLHLFSQRHFFSLFLLEANYKLFSSTTKQPYLLRLITHQICLEVWSKTEVHHGV